MRKEKPSQWLDNGIGRRMRVYPHEVLAQITSSPQYAGASPIDWTQLEPEDARAAIAPLRTELAALSRFVAMIEAIAEGREPATCSSCESRFYPSRSDARYCGPTCRMRAHRQR